MIDQGATRMDDAEENQAAASVINVAATYTGTRTLGPGLRSIVWVQGCPFHCPGCISPDWIPIEPANLTTPEHLANVLLSDPRITGLTFSGGEPMLQASALARLARIARSRRELNIICFTGFQRAHLEKNPPVPGVGDLLEQVDVLIDGPYVSRLNDNRGLRGSANQRIHYLTSRLAHVDFEAAPRKSEIHLLYGQAIMIGVPPKRTGEAFNQAVDIARSQRWELLRYERT